MVTDCDALLCFGLLVDRQREKGTESDRIEGKKRKVSKGKEGGFSSIKSTERSGRKGMDGQNE